MPHPNREQEILKAIRKHLKAARKGSEAITDESLIAVAECSRATFYKYVTKDSEIEREIEAARNKQIKNPDVTKSKARRLDCASVAAELRAELEQAKEGNRELLGDMARLISNLKDRGVPHELIQWAQNTPMIKPDRSVSHAGRSRRKKR